MVGLVGADGRAVSKIIVVLPYDRNSQEYANALDHLQEWNHVYNSDEMKIQECLVCQECGVICNCVEDLSDGRGELCDRCANMPKSL